MRNELGQFLKGIKPANIFKKGMVSPRKGVKLSEETKLKISQNRKGKASFAGKHHSEETKQKISEARKAQQMVGSKAPRWIADRSKLKITQKRNDRAYGYFVKAVLERDGFKCRISNKDCKGKTEVHHILPWIDYPELRYEVNNGITLCHGHHPKKKDEVSRLAPIFNKIIS